MPDNDVGRSEMFSNRKIQQSVLVTAAVSVLALSGCAGSGAGAPGASDEAPTLNVYNGATGTFVENWNPFSPTVLADVHGLIYEPLFYFNNLKSLSEPPVPVLGESYEWNVEGTQLSVTMGADATWSDGTPVTSKDVAFTMNLIQSTPALNTTGNAPTAEAPDDSTVIMTFDRPSFVDGPTFLGRTWIVPEHIWKDIQDPEKNINKDPIGSGPLTPSDFTAQSYLLTKNDNYRDADQLQVDGLRVLSLSGNQAATDQLLAGQLDWAGIFIPDMPNVLSAKPELGYGVSASQQIVLTTCSSAELGCTGPQVDPAVRQAISAAIDRDQINQLAYYDQGTPISPTFALLDRDEQFIASEHSDPAPMQPDVQTTAQLLEGAGWSKGSDGIYEKAGERLSMNVSVTSGYTDYIATLEAMREQLKVAGIEINPQQVANNENTSSQGLGNFQLAISGLFQGAAADPYYVYNNFFNSAGTAPVGESVNPYGNVARFASDTVDAALETAAGTEDPAVKASAYAEIQSVIVEDLPYIPVLNNVSSAEFSTAKVTGFPTADDQYASTNPNTAPDNAQVLMKLKRQ